VITATREKLSGNFGELTEAPRERELLRFTTAGSVDDGKSTLIGRLLHDSKSVYEDQMAAVKKSRLNRSSGPVDFSLLTDGLRAEREQGITIDVAYRYFATSRRKFIIADTPGHEQYTRNMATGASTADLAVILVDATKGILPQTRRHTFIASLLGIRNVLAAINKMDLADFREDLFLQLQRDFQELAGQLGIPKVQCVPVSALDGDNVVDRSVRTRWYQGPTMLEHLETVPLSAGDSLDSLRFPVQMVIRPDANFRGFAGRVASGVIRPGTEVLALPSGQKSTVRSIATFDGELTEAFAPMSVTLQLQDEIDLSRGDMLVAPENPPKAARKFRAMAVWLHESPLEVGKPYLVKHTARQTKIRALRIRHRVNVNSLAHEPATLLNMNEIASVDFEAHVPLFFDPYSSNRTTGSFILIDAITNATVCAGMIQEALPDKEIASAAVLNPVESSFSGVSAPERHQRNSHFPATFLLGNRPGLASRIERALFDRGFAVLNLSDITLSSALPAAVRVTQELGAIAIYSGEVLDSETSQHLISQSTSRLFDLSKEPGTASDEDIFRHAMTLADSLQLSFTENHHHGAN
jgi:sulfate adenylyltransferase large subunit